MHPVKDIGISPWPVDVVEFGADAYAHRKQVNVRQLYNQVPQTTWVSSSSSSSCSWSQLGLRCRSESQLQTEGLGPQWPTVEQPSQECERSVVIVRRTWGQYVAVCSRLQIPSHTQETFPFENKVCEVYFYKEVCPFVHWSSSLLLTMFPLIFVYVYVCG